MKSKDKMLNEEEINKAIAAAYGDGPFVTRLKNYVSVMCNPELRNIYRKYRHSAKAVKSLREEKCPDYVTEGLNKKSHLPFFGIFSNLEYSKLAFSFATVVLLAVLISYNMNVRNNANNIAETKKRTEKTGNTGTASVVPSIPAEKSVAAVMQTSQPEKTQNAIKSANVRKKYASAEVTEQIKESLAMVAKILLKTDSEIEKNNPFEIVEKHLNKSIKAVNSLLVGGKDEI